MRCNAAGFGDRIAVNGQDAGAEPGRDAGQPADWVGAGVEAQMDVVVHQPGQQDRTGDVDHGRAVRDPAAGPGAEDRTALEHHHRIGNQRRAGAIEQPHGPEHLSRPWPLTLTVARPVPPGGPPA
jgi:hypothetical protein